LNVTGNGQTAKVVVEKGDSAKTIAAGLNGSIGGLSATASTQVKFSVDEVVTKGTTTPAVAGVPANFELTVGKSTVKFVGVTDTAGLADQLKSNAAKLGISVNYDEAKGTLEVKSDTGENLSFKSGAGAAAISVNVKDGSGKYAVDASDVETPTKLDATVDNVIVATGQVSLDSSKGYAIADAGTTALFGKADVSSDKVTIAETDVTDAYNAQNALSIIDKAIGTIDSVRSGLGATQNRLTTTADNLQNIQKNSTAARSTVQDVDFASETAELTKQQTLQSASTAILSQANQLPSAVLKLLQ